MRKLTFSFPFLSRNAAWIILLLWISTVVSTEDKNHDQHGNGKRKNIILFLTDDQDVTANSIHPSIMPRLNTLFREGGMEFSNYYVSTGLCCPSRATILRGQYCHNTGILDNGDFNNATYQSGGWDKFLDTQLEQETVATLLQSLGYETALIGKYMNGYEGKLAGHHKPPGWDHWMGLLTCFRFYGAIFSENGEKLIRCNTTTYQTDFIRDWVLDFLANRDTTKPFFLMITPFAPHAPAIPAKRHEHMFPNATFPRSEASNPSDDTMQTRNKPAWIKNLPPLTDQQLQDMDHFYANRLRSLQAIDEALESIANKLQLLGLEDDTYFIYSADNGQHFGDFRMPAGKRQAYETDVLVPFFIRGLGIQKGSRSSQVVQSVDLGPTFLEIANPQSTASNFVALPIEEVTSHRILESSYPMDGKSILPLFANFSNTKNDYNDFRWVALLEMYSGSSNIGLRYNTTKGYYHNHMVRRYSIVFGHARMDNLSREKKYQIHSLSLSCCTISIQHCAHRQFVNQCFS